MNNMKHRKRIGLLVIAAIIIMTFGLCSCGGNSGSELVPDKFKGKWVLCGFAPKDKEMSADNIISGQDLKEEYGIDPDGLAANTVEFDDSGGMKPYTDGSVPGYSTDMVSRVSDTELCYGIEILEVDGKEIYDNPIRMDVHAKLADNYLFVWEEYKNTDEYDESDTYQVYQRDK